MLSAGELCRLQRDQHKHDLRNHSDILNLHKTERLKHYGLHFAKYLGRLARESAEPKPVDRTLVDTFLVSLSAANTLHQDLRAQNLGCTKLGTQIDPLRSFADAAGRFADACEKIDHLEEFVPMARQANHDILAWVLAQADERSMDLVTAIKMRRQELAQRQFYIEE
jgi:hypothetical protein